jgi:dTDP-4-amino-4,6-dideoxygalactose transaminase
MNKKPIYVTQPSLPPLEEFIPYLEQIWENKILTNNGPFHKQLEQDLCKYLGVPYICLFSNATIALITAIKALNLKGEVITTPYSFVATAHSLLWNDINPVFIDIDPITLNLNPHLIEEAITHKTTAIMPVHVYGHPCDVDAIDEIANKHNLKVIYDAAHAFGVKCHCGSILNHGDLSVLSFHATKVFNTFEGGAIICSSLEMKNHIDQLKNFGFTSETTVVETGINGKMNELNAAVGLLQLNHIDDVILKRKEIDDLYRKGLNGVDGIRCHIKPDAEQCNYGYFPIFVDEEYPLTRDQLYDKLKERGINARRYFYPLITDFPMYSKIQKTSKHVLNVSNGVADKVICLPIYPDLSEVDQQFIIDAIKIV